ncbi:hypothetical protein O1L55_27395 [Streptomyces albulus]|nr:hypothetical protein [Streptomyces noursei]
MPRQVRRLKTGYYDLLPPTAEEFEMVTGLYRRAADEARAAGYRTLRWGGRDTGPDGQAATALNAHGHGDYAPLLEHRACHMAAPAGLPDVQVHQLPAHLTLATADAEVSAFIDGHAASSMPGVDPPRERRAARLAADRGTVTRLWRDHPEVTELTIWEFDDAAVRQALPLAGLRLTARTADYELPLTPSRPRQQARQYTTHGTEASAASTVSSATGLLLPDSTNSQSAKKATLTVATVSLLGNLARAPGVRGLFFRLIIPLVAFCETSMRLTVEADGQAPLVGVTWNAIRLVADVVALALVGHAIWSWWRARHALSPETEKHHTGEGITSG